MLQPLPLKILIILLGRCLSPMQVEHFLGLAEEWFDVTRLHDEVPAPWRVHDVIVVLLRLRPAAEDEGGVEEGVETGEQGEALSRMQLADVKQVSSGI